jgi:hypothetical protein
MEDDQDNLKKGATLARRLRDAMCIAMDQAQDAIGYRAAATGVATACWAMAMRIYVVNQILVGKAASAEDFVAFARTNWEAAERDGQIDHARRETMRQVDAPTRPPRRTTAACTCPKCRADRERLVH